MLGEAEDGPPMTADERTDPFNAVMGSRRGGRWVPVARDGSASVSGREDEAHPHGVRVLLRAGEGHGRPHSVTLWVGERGGAVDVSAAIAAAEARFPGSIYQDWGAA
jgi:hypothetical protein